MNDGLHKLRSLAFAIAPLAYVANLLLVFANGPSMILAAGLFFGFNSITMGVALAMAAEMVPPAQMGRWSGMVGLIRGLLSVPAPLLGGVIWDAIGPYYVFVAAILIDLCLRLPLLAHLPETLTIWPDQ